MSKERLGAEVLERSAILKEKEASDYEKKKKAIRKKWKGRGTTGDKEEAKELAAAKKKFMSDTSIKDNEGKDWHLAYEHGIDAPKAKSFMTPKSPKKSPPKSPSPPSGRARRKRNPTPYSDEILKGVGKYKSGGSVGRGMGKALRGGGIVTRS